MAYKDHETRKEEIINATLQIAAEEGVQKATTQAIANRVGIAQPTIFRHFSTRSALFQAAMDWIANHLFHAIGPVFEGDGPADQRLRQLLETQLDFIARHRGLPRLLFSERLHLEDPDLKRTVTRIMEAYSARVAALIRTGQAEGRFHPDVDPDETALQVTALIQGTVMRWSLNEFGFPLEEQADAILALLTRALAPASPGGSGASVTAEETSP